MSPTQEPLVTVLTPVYNGEPFLDECIESVLGQTYDHWEHVIVNNCSTDGSREIAERYAAKDPRIRIHDNEQFVNHLQNHNIAVRQLSAESTYCKIVYADEWIFPDCLRQMVELAETHPSVGVVSAYRLDGVWVNLDGLPYPSTVIPGREICRSMLLGGPRVFGSPTALLYRTEFMRRRDPFFDESDLHSDVDACYWLLQHCDFGFVHQVLTFARSHPGEVSDFCEAVKTYIAARFRHLVTYGPVYLARETYERRLEETLDNYYRFLAKSLVGAGRKEIWGYHRKELERVGYPFTWGKMARVLASYWLYGMLHPVESSRLAVGLVGQAGRRRPRSVPGARGGEEGSAGAE